MPLRARRASWRCSTGPRFEPSMNFPPLRDARAQELRIPESSSSLNFCLIAIGNEGLLRRFTMAQPQSKAITVINPAPTFGVIPGAAEEMISTDVSLETLKASIKELISECQEMF